LRGFLRFQKLISGRFHTFSAVGASEFASPFQTGPTCTAGIPSPAGYQTSIVGRTRCRCGRRSNGLQPASGIRSAVARNHECRFDPVFEDDDSRRGPRRGICCRLRIEASRIPFSKSASFAGEAHDGSVG
jgi:hypothetical protein